MGKNKFFWLFFKGLRKDKARDELSLWKYLDYRNIAKDGVRK